MPIEEPVIEKNETIPEKPANETIPEKPATINVTIPEKAANETIPEKPASETAANVTKDEVKK